MLTISTSYSSGMTEFEATGKWISSEIRWTTTWEPLENVHNSKNNRQQ